jgi:hypothetical protein
VISILQQNKKAENMKWVEIIQLRSTGCNKNFLKTELLKLAEENKKIAKKREVMAYGRFLVDTDYTIHIFHETANVERDGSSLGLRLVSALRAFGLVNHSLWVALDNKENEK